MGETTGLVLMWVGAVAVGFSVAMVVAAAMHAYRARRDEIEWTAAAAEPEGAEDEDDADDFDAGISEAARALTVAHPTWARFAVERLSGTQVQVKIEKAMSAPKVWAKLDGKTGALTQIDWDEAEHLAELHRSRKRQDEITAQACLAIAVRDHVLSVPRLAIVKPKGDAEPGP